MDVLKLTKFAIHLVSVAGVTKVIDDVIKTNTVIVTQRDSIRVTAGSFVLGSLIVEQTSKHVNARIDEVVGWWKTRNEDEQTTGEPDIETT